MNNQMIEDVARIVREHDRSYSRDRMDRLSRALTEDHLRKKLDAAITAYNPDNRLREGLEPSIFDLLEPLAKALDDTGGPDIRGGFARGTGGVDIPFIVKSLAAYNYGDNAKAALDAAHHAELVEALETARDMLLERIHGSPARSAAHNARIIIERALAKIGGRAALSPLPLDEEG